MDISIVICTYNRANALSDTIEAVERAVLDEKTSQDIELIVVDNNSTDQTPQILVAKVKSAKIPMHICTETKQGLSAARNRGLKEAKGKLIAFTDDDCHPDENYISDIITNFAKDGDQLVIRGGKVELGDPTDLPLTIQTTPTARSWQINDNEQFHHLGGGIILGCNMVFPRALYDAVGPFDETIGAGTKIPAAEDTDFVFRCYMKGYKVEYLPNMVVKHFHGRKDPKEAQALIKNYVIGTGALYAKHLWRHPNFKKTLAKVLKKSNRTPQSSQNNDTSNTDSGFSYDISTKDKARLAIKGAGLYWQNRLFVN